MGLAELMTRQGYVLLVVLTLVFAAAVIAPEVKANNGGATQSATAQGADSVLSIGTDASTLQTAIHSHQHSVATYSHESRAPAWYVPQSLPLSPQEAYEIICAMPWPCEEALAVAWRESNWQPHAYNPGCRCVGLFQIAAIHGYTADVLMDPTENTRIAYALFQASGWAPWRVN